MGYIMGIYWDILYYVMEYIIGFVTGICNGIYHNGKMYNRIYYGKVQLDIFDGNIMGYSTLWECIMGYKMM